MFGKIIWLILKSKVTSTCRSFEKNQILVANGIVLCQFCVRILKNSRELVKKVNLNSGVLADSREGLEALLIDSQWHWTFQRLRDTGLYWVINHGLTTPPNAPRCLWLHFYLMDGCFWNIDSLLCQVEYRVSVLGPFSWPPFVYFERSEL